ncbi:MAG TPA: permease-like cell division protein FtsX [Mycobacteriales bacterium]|jgi:cell division transport system permease protein|nr:permease-like cell division protein FtsX [Mycobacteriales bacterium]
MRPRFVLQEIATGLRRNVTMAAAVVVTVMVSLALLGGSMLTTKITNRMHDRYYGQLEVAVYLKADVTAAERDALRTMLTSDPRVARVQYESHEQALAKFKSEFAGQKDLVNSVSGPEALPESFRVKLKNPKEYTVIASKYGGVAGVDEVYDAQAVLRPLFNLLDGVKTVATVVAIVAGAAALLTTFNTIRLAAFSRRREIGIMRLVGASNFTIQLPFVLEGVIAGLVGAVAAGGLLVVFKRWILDVTLQDFFHAGVVPNAEWHEVLSVMPWLALVGVGVAALASYVTSLLYVRV